MNMKTVKTKILAMLMAAVMVFAMAPLATGIAFADEEDIDVAEAADPAEVTDVIDDTEEAEPQLEAAAVEKGELVIDLSNGPVTYPMDSANHVVADEVAMLFGAAGAVVGPNAYKPWISMLASPFGNKGYFDLDMDGSTDIKFTPKLADDESGTLTAYVFEATAKRSIPTSITLKTPSDAIEVFNTLPVDQMPCYYKSMTIILGKDTAKAANTLAVKGKTAKIKYKKLKKKNQTLKLSKVITLTNAGQGAVTYAKAKGNKKIKVAKNGKVTVKKKLKKGTYKVTVNVTAAGNDAYDGITKAVTFKVKVK